MCVYTHGCVQIGYIGRSTRVCVRTQPVVYIAVYLNLDLLVQLYFLGTRMYSCTSEVDL
jgi:hypothetical protein